MLGLLLFKPPDEEAFQSDHRTQMLRLARRNHTQSNWRLRGIRISKIFSTTEEVSHYWKKTT